MNQISQISSELSAALALDLAAGLWSESQVFANHGIDPQYGAVLLQQDWFVEMVEQAKRDWGAIKNARERIKLKSQLAVEMAITDMYSLAVDTNQTGQARVAAFKELREIAGVTDKGTGKDNSGPAVPVVNIYLDGDSSPTVSVSANKLPDDGDDELEMVDITPDEELLSPDEERNA